MNLIALNNELEFFINFTFILYLTTLLRNTMGCSIWNVKYDPRKELRNKVICQISGNI